MRICEWELNGKPKREKERQRDGFGVILESKPVLYTD